MKNIFKGLFKKEKKIDSNSFVSALEKAGIQVDNKPVKQKDIIVKTDPAFYKSVQPKLDEIKSKIITKEIDFKDLEFEEDINDFPTENLSTEATALIIKIIKEDLKDRQSRIKNHHLDTISPDIKE